MSTECNNLPATVDVEVSDVGCVVLVSAYDVDVDISKGVLIGGVVVLVAAVSATRRSENETQSKLYKKTE